MAAPHGFLHRRDRRSRYSLFVPAQYDGQTESPLILFLHGAGETGWDGSRPTEVGIGPAIRRQQDTFGFLTLFPQSHQGAWRAGTEDARRATPSFPAWDTTAGTWPTGCRSCSPG